MFIRHGIKLEQHKADSLQYPVRDLPVSPTLPKPVRFMPPKGSIGKEEIIQACENANIIDEFDGIPLCQKLKRMRRMKIDIVLACCIDEDPYTTSAIASLRENTDAIISGLVLVARAGEVKVNKIVVESEREKRRIRKINPQADLIVAGSRYPARALLKRKLQSDGKRIAYVGAQACAALAAAVDNGEAQSFTMVTVGGDGVEISGNLWVRIGTPVQHLLDFCGVLDRTRLVVTGSSVTGTAITDLSEPVTATTRCVIAMLHPLKSKTYACIGCGRCSRTCPRGIIPWRILQEMERDKPDPFKLLNAQKCIGCASCSIGCPSGLDLAGAVKKAAAIKKSGDFD